MMDQTEEGKKCVYNFAGKTSETGVTGMTDEMGLYF
jgi:hypothetical protein